jgi:hypothetical protein
MVIHLVLTLHENKSAIRGASLFPIFMDNPSFLVSVRHRAVVSTHSLKLDFDVSLD